MPSAGQPTQKQQQRESEHHRLAFPGLGFSRCLTGISLGRKLSYAYILSTSKDGKAWGRHKGQVHIPNCGLHKEREDFRVARIWYLRAMLLEEIEGSGELVETFIVVN